MEGENTYGNQLVRMIYCEVCRRFEPHQIIFKRQITLSDDKAHALGEHGYRGYGLYVECTVFCFKCLRKNYLKDEKRTLHVDDYNALIKTKDNFGIKKDELLSGRNT